MENRILKHLQSKYGYEPFIFDCEVLSAELGVTPQQIKNARCRLRNRKKLQVSRFIHKGIFVSGCVLLPEEELE